LKSSNSSSGWKASQSACCLSCNSFRIRLRPAGRRIGVGVLATADNIAYRGGPKNGFDPDNGYRDVYKKIWGVKQPEHWPCLADLLRRVHFLPTRRRLTLGPPRR
jgi:hypothetical protein